MTHHLFAISARFRSSSRRMASYTGVACSTIIAMIVYAIIAWGIVKLIEINRPAQNTEIRKIDPQKPRNGKLIPFPGFCLLVTGYFIECALSMTEVLTPS